MNPLKDLRDDTLLQGLSAKLHHLKPSRPLTLMEVCGTHTMAIHRAALPSLLPPELKLVSGPGCPVCVTPTAYIDSAIAICREHDVRIVTFGDMMRVPGSQESLADLRREGFPVSVVYSALGALEIAEREPNQQVVFLAVGFETTAPTAAATVLRAQEKKVTNFSLLNAHKLVIPALEVLINDTRLNVDGFLLPGHVSIVLGTEPYRSIAELHGRACVVTGFETADIIQGILMLVNQIEKKTPRVEIQYSRVVRPQGNQKARDLIERVYETSSASWRGFGLIEQSGLALRDEYSDFDASKRFPVTISNQADPAGCCCGDILRGLVKPTDCPLFGSACVPEKPVGPCMVSTEGTCAAFYKSRKFVSPYFNKGKVNV